MLMLKDALKVDHHPSQGAHRGSGVQRGSGAQRGSGVRHGLRSWAGRLAVPAICVALLGVITASATAVTLPDGRAYEQVTPLAKNGVDTGNGVPSISGNVVNWEAIGGCCGATTSSDELFQATRGAAGWTTAPKTPTPSTPLVGLFEEQAPLWWSPDLSQTIYTTPASYAAGDERPAGPGATSYLDLYEQGADGSMSWLTQGPFAGAGTHPYSATFDDATPDGDHVAFDTQEQLTPNATGLADLNTPAQFLYERNVAEGTTNLVNVTTTTTSADLAAGASTIPVASSSAFASGQSVTIGTGASQETDNVASVPDATDITLSNPLVNAHGAGAAVEALIDTAGAIAGNGNFLAQGFLAADYYGTTTNAISGDGSKVFFESPPSSPGGANGAEGIGPTHLYMRDFATSATTPLDNPAADGSAQYEGASQDGSLVFFTSDEGLGGNTNTDNELYEYNTTNSKIGPADAMSVYPVSGGMGGTADGDALGVTAISNDGTHVYFVAEGVLAGNANSQGASATLNEPNFYVFDTSTGATTFIGTLSQDDAAAAAGASSSPSGVLIGEPDITRPAVPTPDGTVLAFDSNAPLTKNSDGTAQNPQGPATTLSGDANSGATSITVASTAGFIAHRTIYIQSPTGSEAAQVLSVPDSTTLDLRSALTVHHYGGDSVTQVAAYEIYRYATADGSLTCVSCTPEGQPPIGSASLGATAGGTYLPSGQSVAMNSTGSEIFFDTPDSLVSQDVNTGPFLGGFGSLTWSQDVYEWQDGTRSLISDGTSATGAVLGGTTPSGNDVLITTMAPLVSQDTDGYDDIYDARVGGGFPAAPGSTTSPCSTNESCHTGVGPTVFFPIPSSETLIAPPVHSATFTVSSLSASQRRHLAKTGSVTLKVGANAAGTVAATTSTSLKGLKTQVAYGSRTFTGVAGGRGKITLHLARAARRVLAKHHKLSLTITVSFTNSEMIDVAQFTLKTKKPHKRKDVRRSVASVHGGRVQGA